MNKEKYLVETPFMDQLEQLGWETVRHSGVPKTPQSSFRQNFSDIILKDVFFQSLQKINTTSEGMPWLTPGQLEEIFHELIDQPHKPLIEANEDTFKKLLGGHENKIIKKNTLTNAGNKPVKLIDFDYPGNNRFIAVQQFRVDTPGTAKNFIIPDIVLFVNGIPLVVVECKAVEKISVNPNSEGLRQLFRYCNRRLETEGIDEKEGDERLFWFNQFMITTTGDQALLGTITYKTDHFKEWKDIWPQKYQEFTPPLGKVRSQETLIQGMLPPDTLLDIIRSFILYKDDDSGQHRIKIVCHYQQYRAVIKALQRLQSGTNAAERSGTVWHTQGSGKSYSMVFIIRKMRHIQDLKDYKILLVNDRIELEDQLGKTAALTGERVKPITSTRSLKKNLASAKSDVSLVMLHKFAERQTDKHSRWLYQRAATRKPIYGKELDTDDILDNVKILDEVNPSEKILIMVDEAHRSQGNILNPSMFNAFPNAAKIAFTGTPLITERHERKTVDIFGYYIDIYHLKDSVKDRNTIPIMYIGNTADAAIRGKELMDRKFEDLFKDRTYQELSHIRQKYGTLGTILEAKNYIAQIAEHLVNHYVNEILVNGFKAQVVTHSQIAAVRYKDAIDEALEQRLEFEKSKPIPNLALIRLLEMVKTAVIISGEGENEDPAITRVRREAKRLDAVTNFKKPFDIKNPQTGVAILVVCDMLLTGFDAPLEQVMYINKRLKEHNLLQAIARVNRRYDCKYKGYIVDYIGFGRHLKEALEIYAPSDQETIINSLPDINTEIPILEDRYRRLLNLFLQNGVSRIREYVERKIKDPVVELDVLEQALELLEDVRHRAAFDIYYKTFLQSLDILQPYRVSCSYIPAALAFGHILNRLRHRYRDDTMDFTGVSAKIRSLVDQHLFGLGIDPIVPPIDLLSPDFEKIIKKHKSRKAAASEMEHAIRKHIKVTLENDPVFYQRLSERLEQILHLYRDDLENRYNALLKLFKDIKTGRTKGETGLDQVTEMPFYDLLVSTAFGSPDARLTPEQKEKVKQTVMESVICICRWIGLVGFWEIPAKQDPLRRELGEFFLFSGIPEIQEHQEKLVADFVALAKNKHKELLARHAHSDTP
jgi:type I restriction enzyme R subunit